MFPVPYNVENEIITKLKEHVQIHIREVNLRKSLSCVVEKWKKIWRWYKYLKPDTRLTNTNMYFSLDQSSHWFFLLLNKGNAQTQVELSVPSSLSLGKAPLTISCRSLKASVINRIQIERKPATGSVYSTLVYVGEGFAPIVRNGKENGDSLLMEQMVLRRISSFNVNITILKGKIYTFFF